MTGVTHSAWRPITAVAYVPGVMALLSDTRRPITAQYRPLPYAAGPVCDQCWMGRRVVAPVGGSSRAGNHCPHRPHAVVAAAGLVSAEDAGSPHDGGPDRGGDR